MLHEAGYNQAKKKKKKQAITERHIYESKIFFFYNWPKKLFLQTNYKDKYFEDIIGTEKILEYN